MKILFVVHAPPGKGQVYTLGHISKIACGRGHKVSVFIMGEGVLNLTRETFTGLASEGVQITVCEHNRQQLKAPEGVEGVTYGSQFDLAGMINEYDRVISFN